MIHSTMHWYTVFWERIAIGILVRSKNISLLAFKYAELDEIIMGGSYSDPDAMAVLEVVRDCPMFIDRSAPDDENCTDPDSLMLERLFHAPDGEKPN